MYMYVYYVYVNLYMHVLLVSAHDDQCHLTYRLPEYFEIHVVLALGHIYVCIILLLILLKDSDIYHTCISNYHWLCT